MHKRVVLLLILSLSLTACAQNTVTTPVDDTPITDNSKNLDTSNIKDLNGVNAFIYREYRGNQSFNTKYYLYSHDDSYDLLQVDFDEGGIQLNSRTLDEESNELIHKEFTRVTESSNFAVYNDNSAGFMVSANLLVNDVVQPIELIDVPLVTDPFTVMEGTYRTLDELKEYNSEQIDYDELKEMLLNHTNNMFVVDDITVAGYAEMLIHNLSVQNQLPIDAIYIKIKEQFNNSFIVQCNNELYRVLYSGVVLEKL